MARHLKLKNAWRDRPLVMVAVSLGKPVRAISRLAHEWGWKLLDLNALASGVVPGNQHPAGAIVDWPPTFPELRKLRALGVPVVRLGTSPHPGDDRLPAVLVYLAAAGRLAADYFAVRNFKDVAFVGYDPLDPEAYSYAMYRAFQQRAEARGMTVHLCQKRAEYQGGRAKSREAKYKRLDKAIGKWLMSLPKPVGVFTYSDSMAFRLSLICDEVGLDVPERVALLGVGNDELCCEMAPVELSSIDLADDEWGRQAALLLRDLMNGDAAPRGPVWVPPLGVVTRRSTDVFAIPDPAVARAVRFIWDHLDQSLLVADIARAVGVKRRKLERGFRDHLNRGINAELCRKRLEYARELLETTRLTAATIARMAGYRFQSYLNLRFRQAFGTSPAAYRRKHFRISAGGKAAREGGAISSRPPTLPEMRERKKKGA